MERIQICWKKPIFYIVFKDLFPLLYIRIVNNQILVKVEAKIRINDGNESTNFPETIRRALEEHYPGKLVSMCGVFLLKKGKAKMHVMYDFPPKPFANKEEVRKTKDHRLGGGWVLNFLCIFEDIKTFLVRIRIFPQNVRDESSNCLC